MNDSKTEKYDPDHWAYNMRRCSKPGCTGVVDDELDVPQCCKCGALLPDGPGTSAIPAPSGRKFQSEPTYDRPALNPRPTNVLSLEVCPFCGAREVEIDMGPHRFVMTRSIKGRNPATYVEHISYPALHCLMCEEGWTDHRAEKVRDETAKKAWEILSSD